MRKPDSLLLVYPSQTFFLLAWLLTSLMTTVSPGRVTGNVAALNWSDSTAKKKKKKLKDDRSFLIIHLTFRSTEVLLAINN